MLKQDIYNCSFVNAMCMMKGSMTGFLSIFFSNINFFSKKKIHLQTISQQQPPQIHNLTKKYK